MLPTSASVTSNAHLLMTLTQSSMSSSVSFLTSTFSSSSRWMNFFFGASASIFFSSACLNDSTIDSHEPCVAGRTLREQRLHLIPAYRAYVKRFFSPFQFRFEVVMAVRARFYVQLVQGAAPRALPPEHALDPDAAFRAALHGEVDRLPAIRARLALALAAVSRRIEHVLQDVAYS